MLECQVKGKTIIEAGVGKKENFLLSSGTSVDCVEEFCYLGDMLSFANSKGSISDIEE